jgi:hypothetical protein
MKPAFEAKRAALQKDIQTLNSEIERLTAQRFRIEGAVLCLNELIEEEDKNEREQPTPDLRDAKARPSKNVPRKTA